jgi:hypothetical protein
VGIAYNVQRGNDKFIQRLSQKILMGEGTARYLGVSARENLEVRFGDQQLGKEMCVFGTITIESVGKVLQIAEFFSSCY